MPTAASEVGSRSQPGPVVEGLCEFRGDVRGHRPGVCVGLIIALPIALWELSLGLWLVVKGFRPEAVARFDAWSDQRLAGGADVDLVGVR